VSALELIIIVVCMACSWFFSGIETGLISINKLRLRHLVRYKVKGAATLQSFLQKPEKLLGATLVGNNIVNTVLSVIGASLGTRWFGPEGAWINTVIVTVLLLVVCEYFPKAWFQSFPAHRCLPFAPLLEGISRLLLPLGRPLMALVDLLMPRPRALAALEAQPLVTRDELIHLARESAKSGALTPEESSMIRGVFELKTITCAEIMIPREKVAYVHTDTTADDIQLFARAQAMNQFPVYHKEKQAFVGVVYIFDVLADENPKGKIAQDYMRPPQWVMQNTLVDHVLPRMRVTRQPVVLVTDEKYNTVGLVTLDDALEEVVGNL
jgi:putative hemolysin